MAARFKVYHYRLVEDRALIGMAVPQLNVDGHRHPRLTLLVDHADITAEVLAPTRSDEPITKSST